MKMRSAVNRIKEYIPGLSVEEVARKYGHKPEEIIKLASNENPLGASPRAVEAIKKYASKVYLYPEPDARSLREALASKYNVKLENVVVGNGGDGILDTLAKVFIDRGLEAIIPIPTFSYYEVFTILNNGKPVFIKRDKNFNIAIEKLLSKVSRRTSLIFLCSPNNPTGTAMNRRDVERILKNVNAIVVVDEAYADFGNTSVIDIVGKYSNLVVLRTFSKMYGLAGLRIGYALMDEEISRAYLKASISFSVSNIAIKAAIAALEDEDHLKRSIELVKKGREYLYENIPFKVYPSQANFVLIDVKPYTSKEVCEYLLKKGIIVRDCQSFRGASKSLVRITIGTEEQNKRLVEALKEFKAR
ncbi:MAG: histidinol-phosphate transaminase [Methanocellales archaeon]